jgi:hypothetical protein
MLRDDVQVMMMQVILPFPAMSQLCCISQTMVLEKTDDI